MALTLCEKCLFFLNRDPLNRNALFHLITDVTKSFKPFLSMGMNNHNSSKKKGYSLFSTTIENKISKKLSYF